MSVYSLVLVIERINGLERGSAPRLLIRQVIYGPLARLDPVLCVWVREEVFREWCAPRAQ